MNDGDRSMSNDKTKRSEKDSTVTVALIARRGTIVVALISLVGAVVVALINLSAQPVKGAGGQDGSTAPSSLVATGVQQQKSAPAEAVSGQVKLDEGMGVDLDDPQPKPVSVSGPNGDIDLYFDGSYISSNRSGLSYYYGNESGAQSQCPKVISEGEHVIPGPVVETTGGQSCLRTSKGTVGWIGVNDIKLSGNAHYIVYNYKLFH